MRIMRIMLQVTLTGVACISTANIYTVQVQAVQPACSSGQVVCVGCSGKASMYWSVSVFRNRQNVQEQLGCTGAAAMYTGTANMYWCR